MPGVRRTLADAQEMEHYRLANREAYMRNPVPSCIYNEFATKRRC